MEVSKLVDVIRFHSRDLWEHVLTLSEDLVEGFNEVWRGFRQLLADLVNVLLPRLLDLVLEIFLQGTPREGLSIPGRIIRDDIRNDDTCETTCSVVGILGFEMAYPTRQCALNNLIDRTQRSAG